MLSSFLNSLLRLGPLAIGFVAVQLLTATYSPAQSPSRLADVNFDSAIRLETPAIGYAALPSGALIFLGQDDDLGVEPWVSDGTVAGTRPLRDVNPGPASSFPKYFVALGDQVFFVATTFEHGEELWATDGTASGTRLYADLEPGDQGSDISQLVVSEGLLYANHRTSAQGTEIAVTNGDQPLEILDLVPGAHSSYPQSITATLGGVVFSADLGSDGVEPYFCDGTAVGTSLVADLWPGPGHSTASRFVHLTDQLMAFVATRNNLGRELVIWHRDTGDTEWVDVAPGSTSSLPSDLTPVGDGLFFSAGSQDFGRELWKWSPGAAAEMVLDLYPGGSNGFRGPMIAADDGSVLFAGRHPDHGSELFRSQGTAAGTALVADLIPGSGSSRPDSLIRVGSKAFFVAQSGDSGMSLYSTDGQEVDEIQAFDQAESMALGLAGEAWLVVYEPNARRFLRMSSGGSLQELEVTTSTSSSPRRITAGRFDGEVLFTAIDHRGREPWAMSIHRAPELLLDTVAGEDSGDSVGLVPIGSKVFFGITNFEDPWLWSEAGVEQIVLDPGQNAFPRSPVNLNGQLLFLADLEGEAELISLDADSQAWIPLGLMTDGPESTIITAGERALLVQGSPTRLWQTDGTSAATEPLTEDLNISEDGDRWGAVLVPETGSDELLFVFAADDGESGTEPYVTDGTSQGTRRLADVVAGFRSSLPEGFFAGPNKLAVFWARPANGPEKQLMVTDGLEVTKLTEFVDTDSSAQVLGATELGWFFRDSRGDCGHEIWFTDGTPAGTRCLDLNPGPDGSQHDHNLQEIEIAVDGKFAYFFAYTPDRGYELWRSDGSPGGTEPLPEIIPGPAGQAAAWPTMWHSGMLIFAANGMDGRGLELWTFNPQGALFFDGFERGNTSAWSGAVGNP